MRLVTAAVVWTVALLAAPGRLQLLIRRHTSADFAGHSGTPDLFLFANNEATQIPMIARFVEVKKPKESVIKDQLAEIAFLNGLGLPTRVLRLVERK